MALKKITFLEEKIVRIENKHKEEITQSNVKKSELINTIEELVNDFEKMFYKFIKQ